MYEAYIVHCSQCTDIWRICTIYVCISSTLSGAFSMYFKTIHFVYFIAVLLVVIVCDLCRLLQMRYIHKSPNGNGDWIQWNNKWIQSERMNGWEKGKRTKEWKKKKMFSTAFRLHCTEAFEIFSYNNT